MRLARRLFDVPIVAVSLIGDDDHWSGTCGEHVTTLEVGETFVAVSDGLLDYFPTPGSAAVAVARSATEATSAGDLIDRISNYVMGHLVMDDLTAIVVRRTG